MVVLGIETSCDETAAALVEETGDAARPWRLRSSVVASQVEIHRVWGGVVPELSARQHIRDICGVVERALSDGASRLRRHRRDAVGPASSDRCSSVCRSRKRWPGRVRCRSSACITSPGTSNRSCSSTASCRCRRSCSSSRAGTPVCTACPSPVRTSCSAARATTRRAKPMTRWRSCSVSDIPAARRSIGWPPPGTIARSCFPRRGSRMRIATQPHLPGRRDFSFSGLKTSVLRYVTTRRESLGLVCGGAAADGGDLRHLRQLPAGRRRDAGRAALRRGAICWRAKRGHCRRRLGQQPAARGRPGARGVARDSGVRAQPGALDRQCRDDCGGRIAQTARRPALGLGAQRRRVVETLKT